MYRPIHTVGCLLGILISVPSDLRADDLGRIFGTIAGEIVKQQLREQTMPQQPQMRQPQVRQQPSANQQSRQTIRRVTPSPQQPQMTLDQRMTVQRALSQAGYYSGEIDGILGSGSRRAIASWQAAMGADGTGYLRQQQVEALIATAPPPVLATAAPAVQPLPSPPIAAPSTMGATVTLPQMGVATSSYADLVHLVLMSDAEAYADEAEEMALPYLAAVSPVEDCTEMRDVRMTADEFATRDLDRQAVELFRMTLADLPNKPRRVEKPITETLQLDPYDFDRGGFSLAEQTGRYGSSILRPGTLIEEQEEQARALCGWFSTGGFARVEISHDGLPDAVFLPMSEDEARAFRANGADSVALAATLVIEPRPEGRGPLVGAVTNAVISDPATSRILWQQDSAQAPSAGQPFSDAALELDYGVVAQIAAPVIEPLLSDDQLREAAAGYFSTHKNITDTGNSPPGSPLPIEAIRGEDPQVIAATNLPQLRESLRKSGPTLPLTLTLREETSAYFKNGAGLMVTQELPLEGYTYNDVVPAEGRVSLHDLLPNRYGHDQDFSSFTMRQVHSNISLDMDRLMTVDPLPMTVEEAARRGLLNGMSMGITRDWTMHVTGARAEDEHFVLDVTLTGLTVRSLEDGAVVLQASAQDFPAIATLRAEADAALGMVSAADAVTPPPAGARFGAEMTDLLQLRYAPQSVDDAMIERMMITRHAMESSIRDGVPEWGRFFRDFNEPPTPQDRAARMQEFREWSIARAQVVPHRLTLHLPVWGKGDARSVPWQKQGRPNGLGSCNSQQGEGETALAQARICAYLLAAWVAPEPLLFWRDAQYALTPPLGLRQSCRRDDAYCRAINNAQSELGRTQLGATEIVQLDRLPVLPRDLGASSDNVMIQIDVEPQGGAIEDGPPPSIWHTAWQTAYEFGLNHGIADMGQMMESESDPILVINAKAVAARLVDVTNGATLGELALANAIPPPTDLLQMPESKMALTDVLGIRLGTPFEDADRIIREHMAVGKVLTSDRSSQISVSDTMLLPYASGRIYVSNDESEMIAIYDEPPAAPGRVVGLWRVLRLPQASIDPTGLRATLVEKYGDPRAVEDIQLAFGSQGVAWTWHDPVDFRCSDIHTQKQSDRWHDESGVTGWVPTLMSEQALPTLAYDSAFDSVTDDPLSIARFCPTMLGVRLARYDGRVKQQPAGDEIVTWLSDNRAYARLYLQSKSAPPPAAEPVAAGGAAIKF